MGSLQEVFFNNYYFFTDLLFSTMLKGLLKKSYSPSLKNLPSPSADEELSPSPHVNTSANQSIKPSDDSFYSPSLYFLLFLINDDELKGFISPSKIEEEDSEEVSPSPHVKTSTSQSTKPSSSVTDSPS